MADLQKLQDFFFHYHSLTRCNSVPVNVLFFKLERYILVLEYFVIPFKYCIVCVFKFKFKDKLI